MAKKPVLPSAHTLLAPYRAKRDFKKTAEPSGAEKRSSGKKPLFLIQKHAATRLHYDFRLELDGVLKSWAVTRGPSLNPGDKRLSVHVEDHPLSYAGFEGTIPPGQYGGGTVMLWDRGWWEPIGDPHDGYAKGNLKFLLHGERLSGEWHLVRMHGHRKDDLKHDNWLLLKHRDASADDRGEKAIESFTTSVASGKTMEQIAATGEVWQSNKKSVPVKAVKPVPKKKASSAMPKRTRTGLPDFVEVQLATLVDAPPKGREWTHEIKFDGYRALGRITQDGVQMITRNRQDWTHRFGPIADALSQLGVRDAIFDGEIVVHAEDGTTSFAALQNALSEEKAEAMHYYAFDLLYLDGKDLRGLALSERKAKLRAALPEDHPCLHFSNDFAQSGAEVYRHACQIALEGIISKRLDRPYRSGRGPDWVKSKCLHEQEFVIAGYTEQPKHPGLLGALLIGYYQDGQLRLAGKVGTGFTQDVASDLTKKLRKRAQKDNPFGTVPAMYRRGAHWVKPELVAQVRFTEWTESGSLRHPAFLGLREDKKASEVVREREKDVGKVTGAPPDSSAAVSPSAVQPRRSGQRSSALKGEAIFAGVTLSHPDKVLFEPDITKRQLAEYYEAIAGWMLPQVAGRPISLVRCPSGGKGCFFQRHAGEGTSEHIHSVKLAGEKIEREGFLVIDDEAGLMALTQMGVLEIHAWGSMAKAADRPDRITFDFDPDPSVSFERVKQAALEVRERLKAEGLESFLKTTGGKGLHVVAPIALAASWEIAKNFTRRIAQAMEADAPQSYTSNIRKATRVNRILIDYFRNDHTASSVAAYSTRARAGAPVAMPIDWSELKKLKNAAAFTLTNAPAYLKKRKADPWAEMPKLRQKLPKA